MLIVNVVEITHNEQHRGSSWDIHYTYVFVCVCMCAFFVPVNFSVFAFHCSLFKRSTATSFLHDYCLYSHLIFFFLLRISRVEWCDQNITKTPPFAASRLPIVQFSCSDETYVCFFLLFRVRAYCYLLLVSCFLLLLLLWRKKYGNNESDCDVVGFIFFGH